MLRRLRQYPVALYLRARAALEPETVPAASFSGSIPLVAIDPVEPYPAVQVPQDLVAALKAELAQSHRQRDEARGEAARLVAQLGEANRAAAQASPEAVANDLASLMEQQRERIAALERQLGDVTLERDEARANLEHDLAERAKQRTAKAGFDLVGSLQESNQALRAKVRTETDRANRAERRAPDAEARLSAAATPPQAGPRRAERPGPGVGVVMVDGVEVVVPWGSRT